MKIGKKLMLGYSGIAILIGIVGYLSATSAEKALVESIGRGSVSLAAKTLENIDKNIYNKIEMFQDYCKDILLQNTIK